MAHQTTFQNPETGLDTTATYAFGRLTIKTYRGGVHWEYANEECRERSEKWCQEHSGRRFRSAEAAADYLESIGVTVDEAHDIRYW